MSPQLSVTADLKALLRRVKLGRCLDTLPERLTLAHQQRLAHHESSRCSSLTRSPASSE